MKDEICRSCIDCAVTRCDNHTSNRPLPRLLRKQTGERCAAGGSLQQYLTDEEDRKLAQVAAGIESGRLPEMAQGSGDHPLCQADGVP